jgi:hypothetical protein
MRAPAHLSPFQPWETWDLARSLSTASESAGRAADSDDGISYEAREAVRDLHEQIAELRRDYQEARRDLDTDFQGNLRDLYDELRELQLKRDDNDRRSVADAAGGFE